MDPLGGAWKPRLLLQPEHAPPDFLVTLEQEEHPRCSSTNFGTVQPERRTPQSDHQTNINISLSLTPPVLSHSGSEFDPYYRSPGANYCLCSEHDDDLIQASVPTPLPETHIQKGFLTPPPPTPKQLKKKSKKEFRQNTSMSMNIPGRAPLNHTN